MRMVWAILALAGLAACDVATQVADTEMRGVAKQAINGVVQQNFPGVNAAPVTNCIVDHATPAEIVQIARSALTGVNDETVSTVLGVAQRPETVTCIATNSTALLQL